MREERLRRRRERNRLRREINEEIRARLVNLCRYLHISVMALHIDWLGEEQIIEIDIQSSAKS